MRPLINIDTSTAIVKNPHTQVPGISPNNKLQESLGSIFFKASVQSMLVYGSNV